MVSCSVKSRQSVLARSEPALTEAKGSTSGERDPPWPFPPRCPGEKNTFPRHPPTLAPLRRHPLD